MHVFLERHDRPVVVFVRAQRFVAAHDAATFPGKTQSHFDRASVLADIRQVGLGMPAPRPEVQRADRFDNDDADVGAGAGDRDNDANRKGETRRC